MTNQTTTTYKIHGTTDERTTCDCCGKTNLKRTVALSFGDGPVVFYGTTCAAKVARTQGIKTSAAVLTDEAIAVGYAQKWLDAGRDAHKIADRVWYNYGFPTEVKNGELRISKFAALKISAS